jgi:hypothetical protein
MTSPAPPAGTWTVLINRYSANLNIMNVDAQGNVTGTIETTASTTYDISGTWNAATNELSFFYDVAIVTAADGSLEAELLGVKLKIPWFTRFYFQGYPFETPGSMEFMQQPGPVSTPPYWRMLAGTYTLGGIAPPSFTGGWVARSTAQVSA